MPGAALGQSNFARDYLWRSAARTTDRQMRPGSEGIAQPALPTRYSREATFDIPFKFDQANVKGFEVFLYVSVDRGGTWNWYGRQPADALKIPFRAARDGEYWFSSVTVPGGTQPARSIVLNAQLRVIVDTTAPDISFDVRQTPNREISASWEVVDSNLRANSLRLEYRHAADQRWLPVAVDQQQGMVNHSTIEGKKSWRLDEATGVVNVRLTVSDQADNVNQVTRTVTLAADASPSEASRDSNAPSSIPGTIPFDAPSRYGFEPSNAGLSRGPIDERFRPLSPSDEENANQPPLFPNSSATPAVDWPRENAVEVESRDASSDPYFSSQTNRAANNTQRTAANPPGVAASPGPAPEAGFSDTQPLLDTPATGKYGLPEGERPRMTNEKEFNLEYSIDAVGPGGVEKVELWITEDSGRTWRLYALDEDRESPIAVKLTKDGMYGFRVVIVGKNGLASLTPRPGDLAELWVGVDTTAPVAEINSAIYGSGPHGGQLEIRWNATDDHLGDRPVALQFSEHAEGPWSTIASGLPNSGQYFWQVDSRVPSKFYLRLEVRDEAGNQTVHELDQPIASAGLAPKGRIRGIQPLRTATRKF